MIKVLDHVLDIIDHFCWAINHAALNGDREVLEELVKLQQEVEKFLDRLELKLKKQEN